MKKLLLSGAAIAILISMYMIFFQTSDVQPKEELNVEYLPNMNYSMAYKAQTPNPYFSNGLTDQSPPPGAIESSSEPLHYGISSEDALRAGRELHNPFEATAAALERGREIYQNFCAVCHGSGGKGDGPVARRGYPPPPSLLADNAKDMQDGRMFHIITYGLPNMPSYAAQVERKGRWQAIIYIRKLQGSQP